jgi:hypothetical protein
LKDLDSGTSSRFTRPRHAEPGRYALEERRPFLIDPGNLGTTSSLVALLAIQFIKGSKSSFSRRRKDVLISLVDTISAGAKRHVDSGKRGAGRQLADRRLPCPTAWLQPHVAVGERPSQVRRRAVVPLRRHEYVRVLRLTRRV